MPGGRQYIATIDMLDEACRTHADRRGLRVDPIGRLDHAALDGTKLEACTTCSRPRCGSPFDREGIINAELP